MMDDALWFEDIINWECSYTFLSLDVLGYPLLLLTNFVNSWVSTNAYVAFSDLDLILLNTWYASNGSRIFWNVYILDIYVTAHTFLTNLHMLFFADYWNWATLFIYYAPELVLAFVDYTLLINSTFSAWTAASVYDLFYDNVFINSAEYNEYLFLFIIYIFFFILLLSYARLSKIKNITNMYIVRFFFFIQSVAHEMRLQGDAAIQIFFLVFFYWTMALLTFDDDYEENLEGIDSSLFLFFSLAIAFFVIRYSIHIFAFLEASVVEGKAVAFVAKQFFRDFLNMFTLMLRFFILLFRLNVYDTLDDFYDSYYIFLGDFDEDEYTDLFFLNMFTSWIYSTDANDDRLFTLEHVNDLVFDLYTLGTILVWKLFLFLLVILEELARVSLALYITYLIIFEIHAVNVSYGEDTFVHSFK